ncbi:ML domain-containing protein [Kitasatospora sp. NPDC051984]|uniref:ML domain-containing protein n=1 Tax=Kitasatospora sp. NPDC051984 TaxID=3364059 RepID=UPI0037CB3F6B
MASFSYEDVGSPLDSLNIRSVTATPDPPEPGRNATLRISGVVNSEIKEGAYYQVVVKVGLIRILQQQVDLFEQLRDTKDDGFRLSCNTSGGNGSIPAGETVLTAACEPLQREIPRAKLKIEIRAYTVDDDDLAALNLTVDFTPSARP